MKYIRSVVLLLLVVGWCRMGMACTMVNNYTVPQGAKTVRITTYGPGEMYLPADDWQQIGCESVTTPLPPWGSWAVSADLAPISSTSASGINLFQRTYPITGGTFTEHPPPGCSPITPPTGDPHESILNRDVVIKDVSGYTANGPLLLWVTADNCNSKLHLHFDGEIQAVVDAPHVRFDLPQTLDNAPNAPETRLVTHNYANRPLSPYQLVTPVQWAGSDPNVPRPQMRITGKVIGAHTGDIYLKVLDPKDSAAYNPSAAEDDNWDGSGGALITSDGSHSVSKGTYLAVTPDASGNFEAILEGSDHVSGDNYRVIASLDVASAVAPCESYDYCDKSAVITVWKQLLLEHADMYKKGFYLADFVRSHAGDPSTPPDKSATIYYSGTTPPVQPGDLVQLVHGYDDATVGVPFHFVDQRQDLVVAPNPSQGAPSVEALAKNIWRVTFTSSVMADYFENSDPEMLEGDELAVPSAGTYTADYSALGPLYAQMFVDLVDLTDSGKVPNLKVPYVPVFNKDPSSVDTNRHLRQHYFQGRQTNTNGTSPRNPKTGMMIAGSEWAPDTPCTAQNLGDTKPDDLDGTILYIGTIQKIWNAGIPGCGSVSSFSQLTSPQPLIQFIAAHESVHTWVGTNPGSPSGHCNEPAVVGTGLGFAGDGCLMNPDIGAATPGEVATPRIVMHWNGTGATADSEYREIRTAKEPTP